MNNRSGHTFCPITLLYFKDVYKRQPVAPTTERLLSRFEIKRGPSFFGYWHLKGLVLIVHHGRVGLRAEGAKR